MKKSFFTGLIVLLPVTITIFVLIFVFNLMTTPFMGIVKPIVHQFNIHSPIVIMIITKLGIVLMLALVIMFLGILGQWFLVKTFLNAINTLFLNVPIIKTIYKVAKEIVKGILAPEGNKPFKHPVIIRFPDEKHFSMGIVSGKVPSECEKILNKKLESVFVPTAPHPITGYMFLATEGTMKKVQMSNEDAIKFIVSCGIIVPTQDTK
jgi:uncharacterized membrane protein